MSQQDKPQPTAPWWEASLNRRELGIAGAAAVAALAGAGALQGCCGDDDDATEGIEKDALSAQQEHGWDFGDQGHALIFNGASDTDSKDSDGWKAWLDPKALLPILKPTQEGWRPFERLTLIQALDQPGLKAAMKPVSIARARGAYDRALALASLLESSKDPEGTLLIVDMPGPEAVALAAGVARSVEPVFFFDNWPHPRGVVRSHETLGALLYYAAELEEAQKARQGRSWPVALILDSQRLAPYQDSSDDFDNRYLADPPSADQLKKLGIRSVLYVTADPVEEELDDLNDAMVALKDADLAVTALALSSFSKDPEAKESQTRGYYYGGSHYHHTYFYTHYPMFLYIPGPRYTYWPAPSVARPPSSFTAPSYKPVNRPTMFSARSTGVTSGVGRSKPTGFGRVSTRVDGSGNVSRGSYSSGRSGSFGRTRFSGGSGS